MIKKINNKQFKKKRTRVLVALLLAFVLHSQISPHIALARSSGGGDSAKFDTGKLAVNIGISLAAIAVGNAIGSGMSGAYSSTAGSTFASGFGSSIGSWGNIGTWVNGYSTYFAASQVGGAISNAGAYYEWSPSTTRIVSGLAIGATAGALNPQGVLGESIRGASPYAFSAISKGAFVGGLGGLASGATIAVIDGNRQKTRIGTQIAGMAVGIYATNLGRTLVDPNTYNTKLTSYFKEDNNYVDPQTGKTLSSGEVNTRSGVDTANETLRERGMLSPGEELTARDLKGVLAANPQETFNLSESQLDFNRNVEFGPNGSIGIPDSNVSSSFATERILVRPIVNTFNDWPLIASRGLTMAATHNMDERWRPVVSSLINAAVHPVVDSIAVTYNLKPSLASNIDEKLGYFPAHKYAKDELIKATAAKVLANKIAESPLNDNLSNLGIVLESFPNLESDDIAGIQAKVIAKQIEYSDKGESFNPKKVVLENLHEVYRGKISDETPLLNMVGGNRFTATSYVFSNVIKREMLIALISGGIQSGLTSAISDSDPQKGMLVSLGGAVAAGIARGIVWHSFAKSEYKKGAEGSLKGEDPGWATHRKLKLKEIVDARLKGLIPLADNQKYEVERIGFYNKKTDKDLTLSEVASLVKIPDKVKIDFKGDLIKGDLSTAVNKLREAKVDISNLAGIFEVVKFTGDTNGKYTKPSDTTLSIRTDVIYTQGKQKVSPSEVNARKRWVLNDATIVPLITHHTPDGKYVGESRIPSAPSLGTTVWGSVRQNLYEFGTNTLAMGLPYTKEGKLSAYAWYNYTQNLRSLSSITATTPYTALARSAGQKIPDPSSVFAVQGRDVAQGVIGRSVLTTLADTQIGRKLDMAPILPVSGYKGMAFSAVVNFKTGIKTTQTKFYPEWPYYRLDVSSGQKYYNDLKVMLYKTRTSQDSLLENDTGSLNKDIDIDVSKGSRL